MSTRIIYWYHPDYVGNVDLVTDLNQEAYEFYLYNPWGESLYYWESGSSSWNSPYRFNSKEFDAETGMHYYELGIIILLSVWMSVDPLVEQTMESYIYSGNNAITLLDPDGKWPVYQQWLNTSSICSTKQLKVWQRQIMMLQEKRLKVMQVEVGFQNISLH